MLQENLIESKHHKMARSLRTGPADRDMKPDAKTRDILKVMVINSQLPISQRCCIVPDQFSTIPASHVCQIMLLLVKKYVPMHNVILIYLNQCCLSSMSTSCFYITKT